MPGVSITVGGGHIDLIINDADVLLRQYRTDTGCYYLDYKPPTPSHVIVPEDLGDFIDKPASGLASIPQSNGTWTHTIVGYIATKTLGADVAGGAPSGRGAHCPRGFTAWICCICSHEGIA